MIVEAVDGKFYKNPFIVWPKWCLDINDDEGVTVKKTGSATWNTARQYAKEGGVKCRFADSLGAGRIILEGRLVPVYVFRVTLRGPIPIPSSHAVVLDTCPTTEELDGEEVISWTK